MCDNCDYVFCVVFFEPVDESFWGEVYLWCAHREGEVFNGVSEISIKGKIVICNFCDVFDGSCFVWECCDKASEHEWGHVGE